MTHDLRPGLHVYSHAGVEIGVIAAVRSDQISGCTRSTSSPRPTGATA